MPKIIQNVREQLLAETKRQIRETGYTATTIRSVAKGCGLGIGTVYNYFESKDMLIASFMAEDWMACLEDIRVGIQQATGNEAAMKCVYDVLVRFIEVNKCLFLDEDAAKVFALSLNTRHKMLRKQIAECIAPLWDEEKRDAFLPEFVAESLLTWTVAGKSFEDIFSILKNLF